MTEEGSSSYFSEDLDDSVQNETPEEEDVSDLRLSLEDLSSFEPPTNGFSGLFFAPHLRL